jgi:DNA-binding transcriptional ArsR family regulator
MYSNNQIFQDLEMRIGLPSPSPQEEVVPMPDMLQRFKAEFFKSLAHPVRIRLLEVLRGGEKSVTELQNDLGLDQSTVSQHLSVLRNKGLLTSRKLGVSVLYQVREPLIFDLLDVARAIFNNHLLEMNDLLDQLTAEQAAIEEMQRATSPKASENA